MKIRVMGTIDECRQVQDFYRALGQQSDVKYYSVSEPYQNRGSVGVYRVYIEIVFVEDSNIFGSIAFENKDTEWLSRVLRLHQSISTKILRLPDASDISKSQKRGK